MTHTPASLAPQSGDVLIRCRDTGDPATLWARLRRFIKRLGRAYSIEVVSIEDVEVPARQEVHEDDGSPD